MKAAIYEIEDPAPVARLLAELAAAYPRSVLDVRRQQRTHLDTFDWRLHRAGLTCVCVDDTCRLEPIEGGRARAVAARDPSAWPRAAGDLAPGRMRDLLAGMLEIRALIPLVTIQADTRAIRVRDRNRRVVARLVFTTWRLAKRRPVAVLRALSVQPARDRRNLPDRLRRMLKELDLTPPPQPPLAWALAASGLVPRSYSAKIDVTLTPDLTARAAAQAIGRRLLATMRQNERGLKADIDTEFLHDFRVAVRRTRAALGELKGVFPPRPTREFTAGFRDLGRLTGPVRDLDVYLLAEAEIHSRIQADLRPGLVSLFDTLRTDRAQAQRTLVEALANPSYGRFLRRWAALLGPPPGRHLADSPAADLPVQDYARARIYRRWRRLIDRGLAITDDSPATDLHTLRIHAKKLRYLLEFFVSLFPGRQINVLVRHLKGLQDNLGEHNDLVVQQEHLRSVLVAASDVGEAAAIEALLDVLAARQREVRHAFAGAFADFAGAEVTARFEQLFGLNPPSP